MNFMDVQKYNNRISTNNHNKLYSENNISMSQEVPVSNGVGNIVLLAFTERGQFIIPGALVSIYARHGDDTVPVSNLLTQSYPVTIRLPVSHPLGTLIKGPEYYFTTYNITIEAERFCPVKVFNIRIFPGITEQLDINMLELPPDSRSVPETIIEIPSHPRDIITRQGFNSVKY